MGRRRLVAELRFPPVRLDLVIKISALYAPFAQYVRIQHGLYQSQRRPFWRPKDPIQLTPERADLVFRYGLVIPRQWSHILHCLKWLLQS